MKFVFCKEWHEFKVGDRVPASVNKPYLLRQGYIKRYSHFEAVLEQETESIEAPPIEAPQVEKSKGKKK
jgi:hypothetical protein